MIPNRHFIILILLISFLPACASVTGSPNQSVSLQTRQQDGTEISGAKCDLTNKRGTWFITSPGSVSIHRSNDDLQVTCRKEGLDPGRASVVSETKGSMFGNILLGGGIGAIVDHNNGSAYEYPTLIEINMGTFTQIGISKKEQSAPSNPMMGAAGQNPTPTNDQQTITQNSPVRSTDTGEELKKLKELYDQKLISDDVYVEQQKRILEKN